jgi:hypothetical protein
VTPAIGDHPDGATKLVVTGSGFEQRLVPDADSPGHSKVLNPRIVFTTTSGAPACTLDLAVTTATETSLTTTIDPSQIQQGCAGYYDVSVVNPDGPTSTKPKSYFMKGPFALVIGNGSGLATTSALLPVQVFDGQGNLTGLWNDLTITPAAVANTSLFGPAVTLLANDVGGNLVVYDHVAPQVVGVTTSASNLLITNGVATFGPGPAFWAHVPDATKSVIDNKAHTRIQIEDVYRNLTPAAATYSALLQNTQANGCASVTITPGTMSITAGLSTSAEITVSCVNNGATPNVHPLENGSTTGYLSSDGTMTF